jgi:hypothetical protein
MNENAILPFPEQHYYAFASARWGVQEDDYYRNHRRYRYHLDPPP